ncbi:Serine/threonine-protein kinase CTR1 [Tetrabaena socialis]|uniref:Serine/threonine-protein kinase CTR1 n=1 Tax=Tetrabaena socialis TaxID=47790 RepID=A0A2J8AGM9_9CHLO|nr:Serine/threonine-protein kinase CTR1 [Tetrabaena socialis]|eukprot:PNH11667.1 Serine/threonine-protein kinase CTR1 [Tetrabaena socialis]
MAWRLPLLCLAALLVSAHAQSAAPRVVRTQADFIAVLKDESVAYAQLGGNLRLAEGAEWGNASLVRSSNFTLDGGAALLLLDFNLLTSKLMLMPGVTLEFRSMEARNVIAASGVEGLFIAASPGATLLFNRTAVYRLACAPSEVVINNMLGIPRPGDDKVRLGDPWCRLQKPIDACYASTINTANFSVQLPKSGNSGGGYVVVMLGGVWVCKEPVTLACVLQRGTDVCVREGLQRLTALDRTWELLAEAEAQQAAGGGGGSGGVPAGAIAGAAVGGVAGLALLAAALILLHNRRQRRRAANAAAMPTLTDPSSHHGGNGCSSPAPHKMAADPEAEGYSIMPRAEGELRGAGAQAAHGGADGGGVTLHIGDLTVATGVCLGQGSFGRVFKGSWHGQPVAVKVLQYGEDRRAAVHNEVQLSQALHHPNIVRTMDFIDPSALQPSPEHSQGLSAAEHNSVEPRLSRGPGSTAGPGPAGGKGFLVMELCEGGSLHAWRRTQWTAPGEQPDMAVLLRLAHQMACGMSYLHRQGVCHGDVKLCNVLLGRGPELAAPEAVAAAQPLAAEAGGAASGGVKGSPAQGMVAKVCDFGLSRMLAADATHASTRQHGTATHMSPEMWAEGNVSQQSDTYSFGVTLWELATGDRPWRGLAPGAILHSVMLSAERPPLPPWLPPAYALLVRDCWAQTRQERPSFARIVERLEAMIK